jgi:hypothetical protein
MSMTVITPAGPTYRLTVGSSTSTATTIVSDVPVNAYQFANDGSNPVQIKFYVNSNPNTSYVSWPTTSTGVYDTFIQHGVDNQTVFLPARLASSLGGFGGFTTTVVVSAVCAAGTPALYITPVQV